MLFLVWAVLAPSVKRRGVGLVEQGNSPQDNRTCLLAAVSWLLGQSWWEVPKAFERGALHVVYCKYRKLGENEVCTLPL